MRRALEASPTRCKSEVFTKNRRLWRLLLGSSDRAGKFGEDYMGRQG